VRAINDFTWAELGQRVRHLRLAGRLTQQQLADRAGITQNAIFRIEAGETNPQISTLSGIASALGTSVRELLGPPDAPDAKLAPWVNRLKKILGSGDHAAIQAMQNGMENSELLLARGFMHTVPPLVVKGEDRPPTNLFWSKLPIRRRLVTVEERQKGKNRRSKPVLKTR
jgi:transcriptional regulator with XRE-family HTH domain